MFYRYKAVKKECTRFLMYKYIIITLSLYAVVLKGLFPGRDEGGGKKDTRRGLCEKGEEEGQSEEYWG